MQCIKCDHEIPDGSLYCNFCGRKQVAAPRRRTRGNGMGTAVKRGRTWTAIYTESIHTDENGKLVQKRRSDVYMESTNTAATPIINGLNHLGELLVTP